MTSRLRKPRVEVGPLRRAQIVEAAVGIIAEQGLDHLSLSRIEKRAGMSRGQLTYYFHEKEDILLAVFDRLLELLRANVDGNQCPLAAAEQLPHGWERAREFLTFMLLQPPEAPEFHSLQYTFLSQIGHRADFRQRLANLYEEWRSHIAEDLAPDLGPRARIGRKASPRTVATLIQAVLHGLAIQRAADPDCYDRHEMMELCVDLFGSYCRPSDKGGRSNASTNGHTAGVSSPRRPRKPRVNHE